MIDVVIEKLCICISTISVRRIAPLFYVSVLSACMYKRMGCGITKTQNISTLRLSFVAVLQFRLLQNKYNEEGEYNVFRNDWQRVLELF